MQFNLALTAAAGRCPGRDQSTAAQFLGLLQASPRMGALREEESAHESEQVEREEERQRDDLVHGGDITTQAKDAAVRAEQRMEPGSCSWRRAQVQAQYQEGAEQRGAEFRSALSRATETQSGKPAETQASVSAEDGGSKVKVGQEMASQGKETPTVTDGKGAGQSTGKNTTSQGVQLPTAVATRAAAVLTPASVTAGAASASVRSVAGEVAAVSGASTTTRGGSSGSGSTGVQSSSPVSKAGGAQPGFNLADGARAERTAGKSAAAATTDTREAEDSGKSDANMARLLRTINLRLGRGQSRATMRLDPPELGKVRLQMDLRNENLTLQIETQTDQARRLLSEHLDALRQSLELSGVRLEQVDLRVATPAQVDLGSESASQPDVQSGQQDASARSDGEAAGGGGTSTGTEADEADADWMSGLAVAGPLAEPGVDILA